MYSILDKGMIKKEFRSVEKKIVEKRKEINFIRIGESS